MKSVIQNSIYVFLFALAAVISLMSLSCSNDEALRQKYRDLGKIIASESFQTLSKALSYSIIHLGIEQSIEFCHSRAYPITDSLATAYQAKIKRMAVRNRNPENEADELAAKLIEYYTKLKAQDKNLAEMDTLIKTKQGQYRYFKPILLQGQCLVCHGSPGVEIVDPVYTAILDKYPTDKAINFAVGDVRGIWSITFENF